MPTEPDVGTLINEQLKTDHMVKYSGDAETLITFVPKKPVIGSYHLDSEIIYLKHSLKDVRELILFMKSMLTWDKQWHPYSLVGGSTILFMFLWLAEPSLLTTISTFGLVLTLADYFLPSIITSFVNQANWNLKKEKEFEDACCTIVLYKAKLSNAAHAFYLLRTTRPKIYYGAVILLLTFLAWIGNTFNNLFLTYILVTSLLLVPGLEKQGILPKYGNMLTQKLSEFSMTTNLMESKNKKE